MPPPIQEPGMPQPLQEPSMPPPIQEPGIASPVQEPGMPPPIQEPGIAPPLQGLGMPPPMQNTPSGTHQVAPQPPVANMFGNSPDPLTGADSYATKTDDSIQPIAPANIPGAPITESEDSLPGNEPFGGLPQTSTLRMSQPAPQNSMVQPTQQNPELRPIEPHTAPLPPTDTDTKRLKIKPINDETQQK